MIEFAHPLFLQAAPGGGAGWVNLAFIAMLFAVFYFFMIRPQNKRQKEQRTFVEALEKGMEVVTAGGVIGKITKIEENIVTLEISNKTYLRVSKSVVSKDMTEGTFNKKD
jgi:preprotein translocase subunit YajC